MQRKEQFIKNKLKELGPIQKDGSMRRLTPEQISEFYKRFLDSNYELHKQYNRLVCLIDVLSLGLLKYLFWSFSLFNWTILLWNEKQILNSTGVSKVRQMLTNKVSGSIKKTDQSFVSFLASEIFYFI